MSRFRSFLVLFWTISALFWSGCGLGKPLIEKPRHLAAGDREIVEGQRWYGRGCYKKALDHFLKAHELFTVSDQIRGKAVALNNLGNCFRLLGDPGSAALFLAESSDLLAAGADPVEEIQARVNLAAALADQGKFADAQAALDRAESLQAPAGKGDYWPLYNTRGVILLKQEKPAEARQALDRALAATGWPAGSRAAAHHSMGTLLLATGAPGEAAGHFARALEMDRETGYSPGIADDLSGLARAEKAAGNPTAAAGHFRRAAQVYGILGMDESAKKALDELSALAPETGADDSVTRFFLDRWERGAIREKPCD